MIRETLTPKALAELAMATLNQSEIFARFLRWLTDAAIFDTAIRFHEYFDLLGGMFDRSKMLWRLLQETSPQVSIKH